MIFFYLASPKYVFPQFIAYFSLRITSLTLFWLSEVFFRKKVEFSVLAPNSNFEDNLYERGQYLRTCVEIEKIGDVTQQFQQISSRCKKSFCSSMSWGATIRSLKINYSKKKVTWATFFDFDLCSEISANFSRNFEMENCCSTIFYVETRSQKRLSFSIELEPRFGKYKKNKP